MLPALTVIALAIAATVTDLRRAVIPRWLTAPTLVVGIVVAIVRLGWLDGIGFGVGGAAVCGAVPYFFHRRNAMGFGDVMLLAATGAWLGPMQGIEVEFVALLLASIYGMALMAWDGTLMRSLGTALGLGMGPLLPQKYRVKPTPALLTKLRFAPAVLAALVAVVLPPLLMQTPMASP